MQNLPNSSQDSLQNAPQPSNVRRLILPSISVAALVFGVSLTILGNYRTEWFERRAEQSQRELIDRNTDRSYVLTNQGRDSAIRVVGMAIVLSVATGIVTVELLRKRYAASEKDTDKMTTHAAVSLGIALPIESPNTPLPIGSPIDDQSSASDEVWSPNSDLTSPDLTNWPTTQPIVQLLPGTYETDRQVLPGTLHRQLVLNHEGQNYRFLRTAETPEHLRLCCDVCERSNRAIVITVLGLEPASGFGLWERVSIEEQGIEN